MLWSKALHNRSHLRVWYKMYCVMNQFPIWFRIFSQSWLFLVNFWEMRCLGIFKILKRNLKTTTTPNNYVGNCLCYAYKTMYLSYTIIQFLSIIMKKKTLKTPCKLFKKTRIKTFCSLSRYPTIPLSVRPSVHSSPYQLERHLAAVSARLLLVNRLY